MRGCEERYSGGVFGAFAGLMLGTLGGLAFFGSVLGVPVAVAAGASVMGWAAGVVVVRPRRARAASHLRDPGREQQRLEAHRAVAALDTARVGTVDQGEPSA